MLFHDDDEVIDLWRRAGTRLEGERVFFERGTSILVPVLVIKALG